jgi:hypothetical protein
VSLHPWVDHILNTKVVRGAHEKSKLLHDLTDSRSGVRRILGEANAP